jgi:hypothetical protein
MIVLISVMHLLVSAVDSLLPLLPCLLMYVPICSRSGGQHRVGSDGICSECGHHIEVVSDGMQYAISGSLINTCPATMGITSTLRHTVMPLTRHPLVLG